jgi:hypothetical protein
MSEKIEAAFQEKGGEIDCKKCENYKFAVKELHRQRIFKFLKFIAILAFVAVLSVVFDSYMPCLFLLLLFL